MNRNSDVRAVARAAIEEFGLEAASAMEKRAAAHRAAKEMDGAAFWQSVADAVREIQDRAGH